MAPCPLVSLVFLFFVFLTFSPGLLVSFAKSSSFSIAEALLPVQSLRVPFYYSLVFDKVLCLPLLSFDLQPLQPGQPFVCRSPLALRAESLCAGLERVSPESLPSTSVLWYYIAAVHR